MIRIYNSLTRKKEVIKSKILKLFVCGPTVYDYSHIGHARIYVFFDSFVRFLRNAGSKVKFLMNITDIDDKIINRAKEENKKPLLVARKFEREFIKDIEKLKIKIDILARASEHIGLIIKQIEALIKKGYAYITPSGSVYFRTRKFRNYGKLSRQDINELKNIESSEEKEDPLDFALWKGKKDDSEPNWKTPWGYGRPGWHIEDTAITEKYFGVQYDIHGGGIDLIFPHHECEIAQQESASGKSPFVKIWMHVNLLYVNGEKMSKSLGNFIAIRDFLKQYPARFLRFFILSHHWRSIIDYNENTLKDLENKYFKINEFLAKKFSGKLKNINLKNFEKRINESLNDDFNTAKTINILLELINKCEKENSYPPEVYQLFKKLDKFFLCFLPWKPINKATLQLIKKREELRLKKDFKKADFIRENLKKKFIFLEDTKERTLAVNLN